MELKKVNLIIKDLNPKSPVLDNLININNDMKNIKLNSSNPLTNNTDNDTDNDSNISLEDSDDEVTNVLKLRLI